jgi:hypothetical protein
MTTAMTGAVTLPPMEVPVANMPRPRMIDTVDQRSGRMIVGFVGVLAVIGLVGYLGLVFVMLQRPPEQVASYALAVAGAGPFVGVLIGGLVNALTVRSGGTVDDLQRVVGMTYVPGSQEGMSAGVWPASNVPHDPTAGSPLTQSLAQQPFVVNTDPTVPGPTPPTA